MLQRADGRHLLILWRTAQVWDREGRRPLRVPPRRVVVRLPGARSVRTADPLATATAAPLRLRGARARLRVAGGPIVLEVEPGGPRR